MPTITIPIDQDELQGLEVLARRDSSSAPEQPDVEAEAQEIFREALKAKLRAVTKVAEPSSARNGKSDGTVESIAVQGNESASAPVEAGGEEGAGESSNLVDRLRSENFRRGVLWVVGAAVAIGLVGGYGLGWSWTGFRANNQLWDWLTLLLLPVTLATIPLWMQHGDHIGRTRQRVLAAVLVLCFIFVWIGYAMPLGWTGFEGNTLWDWLTLVLLPIAVIIAGAWPASGKKFTSRHQVLVAVLLVAWLVTVIGGYAMNWSWTGYQGNTLWDWLQLMLAPILVPLIVMPAAVAFLTGDVERRLDQEAKQSEAEQREVGAAISVGHTAS